jgi:hypothetical protein
MNRRPRKPGKKPGQARTAGARGSGRASAAKRAEVRGPAAQRDNSAGSAESARPTGSRETESAFRIGVGRWALLALLVADTALLATLELFFLPERMDGTLLPNLGAIPLPLTVAVAVLTTPLLVTQAGRQVHPKAAFVPLLVWVLTVLVLGLTGPGGDLVLIQDWRALLLLAGGALPAAMALGSVLATSPGRKA